MPWVERDGVSLHYEVDQPDEAVVFVQGLGFGRWMWRWQREAVVDRYRTIVPDNRGTGRSDVPGLPKILDRLPLRLRVPLINALFGYTVAEMAADLEAVLADVDVRHVHLVGASLGGMIAQEYAIEYDRLESLVLFGTTPGGPDALPIPEETRRHVIESPTGAGERTVLKHRMEPAFSDAFLARNPHLVERIVEWRLEQDADVSAQIAQASASLGFDASERLGAVDVPTLIVHGDDDRVVPVANGRLLEETISESTYVEIEGGSHLFFIEDPDPINERLLTFLAEHRVCSDESEATGASGVTGTSGTTNETGTTTVRDSSDKPTDEAGNRTDEAGIRTEEAGNDETDDSSREDVAGA